MAGQYQWGKSTFVKKPRPEGALLSTGGASFSPAISADYSFEQ